MANREEKNKKQRAKRRANNNLHTRLYEKTVSGFLMRLYRNMKSRILGIQYKKKHLYENKCLLSKENFYEWSKMNETFILLFNQWKESNYERRLTPSVDRINSAIGYTLENMEWVPFHVNCSRGSKSRNSK
jgi:hypothetical protein